MRLKNLNAAICAFLLAACMSACSTYPQPVSKYPSTSRDDLPEGDQNNIYAKPDSIFGPRGVMGALHDALGSSER